MWERIEEPKGTRGLYSHRLKVPGGWIVRSVVDVVGDTGVALVQTFVSDLNYEWKLNP